MSTDSPTAPGSPPDSLREEEATEKARHNIWYAEERAADLRLSPDAWQRFEEPTPSLDVYTAFVRRMGDLRGLRVLDIGCGDGWLSVVLAKRGAQVEGFDISEVAVETAGERAGVNDVADRCDFRVASIYDLPYEAGAFDLCVGNAIIHHVGHKQQVAEQLHRVMKPGTRALFAECFGNHLWLEKLRLLVPVKPNSDDDPDEWAHQLKYSDLEIFEPLFEVDYEEFQLLSRLDRLSTAPRFVQALGRLDAALLRGLPFLRSFARTILLEFTRRS